jgi:hypothetical protein
MLILHLFFFQGISEVTCLHLPFSVLNKQHAYTHSSCSVVVKANVYPRSSSSVLVKEQACIHSSYCVLENAHICTHFSYTRSVSVKEGAGLHTLFFKNYAATAVRVL